MTEEMINDDPAPDFSEDLWMTPAVELAANQLMTALYEASAGVAHVTINVSHLPGDPFTLQTDYGKVEFTGEEAR